MFARHPLHHLRISPDIIAELMEGMSEAQAIAKRRESDYSLAEMLEYLSHSEAHCFRVRLDALQTGGGANGTLVAAYDRDSLFVSGTFSGRDPSESFAHWQERRDDNLQVLEDNVENGPADRAALLHQLLREWAAHDLRAIGVITTRISEELYEGRRGGSLSV